MVWNRSAPPGSVVPVLAYEDVAAAIDWLCGAFGFRERLRTPREAGGTIHHAQIAVGAGAIMLTARPAGVAAGPAEGLFVPIDNVDRHLERARRFGAKILADPRDCEFGERQYSAEDLGGYRWTFSQSLADVDPADWGAQVRELGGGEEFLPRPRFCYIEIPAPDPHGSANFYERVFGWRIRHRESTRPSFDDASGVSGAFTAGRKPIRAIETSPGLLPYIWVDSISATLSVVRTAGGEVIAEPNPDEPGSPADIALFRDPAGNLIGLHQQR